MDRYDGFHEFVVARGGALSRTAFLLTGEHHAAEDLVQSALAKAAMRWRWLVEHTQPEAYIRRIMINEQISWWRRRPARPVAQVPERAGPDEPGQVVERIALGQALATLTPRQRAVVVLRFYEDLSEADTAALMGCSVGTVKSQTNLALTNLRRSLPLVAEHAGQYADAQAALVTARRRRTRLAGAAVALVAVPLLGLIWYALAGAASAPAPVTNSPSPSARALPPSPMTPPALPAHVPAGGVLPDLPADHGVRGGTLLLAKKAGDDRDYELVAGDGRRYRLPSAPTGGFTVEPVLSPDGRWLLWSSPQGTVVRELTTATVHLLPYPVSEARWSPSAVWLHVRHYTDGGETLVRVGDWAVRELDVADPVQPVAALLDSGELLRLGSPITDTAVTLDRIDPLTGAARRITVDLRGMLRAGESAVAVTVTDLDSGKRDRIVLVLPVADGTAGVEIVRSGPGSADTVSAVVRFTLVDGRAMQRIDLSRDGFSMPLCFHGSQLLWTDGRAVIGSRGDYRLPLDPVYGVKPPGCLRVAEQRQD
ncbi:SigE family RNA polymerase sigma factor [Catellatospora methionotrophica]|uniref:SigE family RNA polymerase sigma factor n=1 Tax=Catellatospora methionotrophica TaxID=121620 RepID=UPI0033C070C4